MFFSELKIPSSYYLVDTFKKMAWLQDLLPRTDVYAFDIETNYPTTNSADRVKDWKSSGATEFICGMSYAWGRNGVESPWKPGNAAYIPLVNADGTPYWGRRQDAVYKAVERMQTTDVPKVAHNGKFDCFKLRKLLGIKTTNFNFDTMLAHSLVDEECLVSGHSLKSSFGNAGQITWLGMSDAYLDISASAFKRDLEDALVHYDPAYKRYSNIPLDVLYPYGCADADLTLSLMYVMREALDAEGLSWNFDNLLMPLQHRLMLMSGHGVPLDIDRALRVKEEQAVIMAQTEKEVHQILGRQFNVASNQQLGGILFEELKLKGGRKNKHGWVVDGETLEALEHPVKHALLKYRRAAQIYSTFVVSSLEKVQEVTHDGKIGWVHTDYDLRSKTARLKSNNPNLSQLPKKDKGGDIVKGLYCCPDDYRFVFMDQSQIELRVIAHLSQEPVWIDGFNAGHDMHAAMAHKVFNLPCDVSEVAEKYSTQRSYAKTINFGIAYGRSVPALAQQLSITNDEAHKLIYEDYFGGAPILKQWIDNTQAFAEAYGYVNTIFNRRRHLPDAQLQPIASLPWPHDSVRPNCYRDGPYLSLTGITLDDIYTVPEYQIKEQLRLSKQGALYKKCLGCPYVKSCIVNREKKFLASKKAEALRQAVNSPVQGSAVEMVSFCAIWIGDELTRQGLDSRPVLHIHDEIGCYSHVSCVEQTANIMRYYMEDYLREFTGLSVPLIADPKVCQRWSDK